MKTILCSGFWLYASMCCAQNVGIGTLTPAQKLDINGNIGLRGRQAISDQSDGWLRLNQNGEYVTGVYSPGFLRIDGGIASGSASSLGSGTILATSQIQAPIFYDYNNTAYYIDPASTSNINVLRFGTADCLNGSCPTNGAIRFTPNFHLNANNGYAVILNWDNGTTAGANVQQLRVGNGQGSDAFSVTSAGNVFANGSVGIGTFYPSARLHVVRNALSGGSYNANSQVIVEDNTTSYVQLSHPDASESGILSYNVSLGLRSGVIFAANNSIQLRSGGNINRVYIDNGGYTGINRTPSQGISTGSLQVTNVGSNDDIFGIYNASGNHWTYFMTPGTSDLTMFYNGVTKGFWSNLNGVYTSTSDRNLKKDLEPIGPVLPLINKITPFLFHYVDNSSTDPLTVGFMAQDVQPYFPIAVKSIINKDGSTYLGIQYQFMTVYAIKAIQEQQQQIDQLKKQYELLLKRLENK